MSQPIQRQADQWSLPDRQASSTYEPSQDELRDLLGGPRIQAGLLNTREASKEAGTSKYAPGGKLDRERQAQEDAERRSMFDQYYNEFKDNSHPSYYRNFDDALDSFHDYMLDYGTNNDIFGDEDTCDAFYDYLQEQFAPQRRTRRRSNTIRQAVPRENPAGDLNMSPRKLDQQVTQQVTNKALKPPKPKPIPDDLGQDQSFKVPNQLKAHRDPQLPPRGYLDAFVRQAGDDEKKPTWGRQLWDQATSGISNWWDHATQNSAWSAMTGKDTPKDTLPGGSGLNSVGPHGAPGAAGRNGPASAGAAAGAGDAIADGAKGQTATPATNVSVTSPSGGGGGGGNTSGGGGGGGTGGGWQARDIAPGSIDTSKPYTVQSGDTLAEIAQGAGIKDYNDIAKSNNIADPNKIDVGQQINFSPSPGGPSTSVSDTPDVSGVAGADFVRGNAPDMAEAGPGGIPLGATSPTPIPEAGGGTGAPPPPPNQVKANRFVDPPLPPKGQLKKFWAGSRRLADTTNENPGWFDDQKKNGPKPPLNTDPGLTNPAAPPGGIEPPKTPSQKAGEPVKPPPATPAPSQPTSPNTPASSDATQAAPGKTNDLAGASNPTSPKSGPPGGNNPSPSTPQSMDQPKTPGTYGPDLGNGVSLSDAMGVIGGIGQGINTALSAVGTIGSGLMGALSGGGLSGLISGFGGLGMLGSSLGITAAAQQQIEASERAVKEQYV